MKNKKTHKHAQNHSASRKSYDTLSEAINDAYKRGYTYDFNLKDSFLECRAIEKHYTPEQFEIVEMYRFEGMSSVDDSSVLYFIEAEDNRKGILVDSYGVYAEALSYEMLQKLRFRR